MKGKNNWTLFILILAGIVLGGFLGNLAQSVPWLSWLNYGQPSGVGSGHPGADFRAFRAHHHRRDHRHYCGNFGLPVYLMNRIRGWR